MLASKQVDGMSVRRQGSLEQEHPGSVGPGDDSPTDAGPELSAARLRIAVARVSRRLRSTAAAGHLTATEVDVLLAAERRGPVRLSDLAAFAGLNPTMLSRLVPKLEQAGLIRRLGDDEDRRVCRVEATGKGSELLERVRSERNDVLAGLVTELAPSQRQALAGALPVLEELAERLVAAPARPTRTGP